MVQRQFQQRARANYSRSCPPRIPWSGVGTCPSHRDSSGINQKGVADSQRADHTTNIYKHVDNNIYSRRMFCRTLLRQVYYLCSGNGWGHYWRNIKYDLWQMRRNLIIMMVMLPVLGMALFFLLEREPLIIYPRCSMMTSTSLRKCTQCSYLIPYLEGKRRSSIDYAQLEEDREHFNTTQTEWIWTVQYYILLVSDKKLNWADRKGDKPFGKSPKICNFAYATIKIQIYGQRYKFLRTAGTKSANKIDGQAKN